VTVPPPRRVAVARRTRGAGCANSTRTRPRRDVTDTPNPNSKPGLRASGKSRSHDRRGLR
jgi:hypothetical protein